MGSEIKRLVAYYVNKFGTRDPHELAKCLNVEMQICELGAKCGCYMFLKNHRCIFLNQNLTEHDLMIVLAHELGHALLHRKSNSYFIRNKTLLSNNKMEIEANEFAAELLITEDMLSDFKGYTIGQFSRCTGIAEELIKLKLKIATKIL